MTTSQDAQIREWMDRLAIQDAIHRYSDAVTRGDYEQMATVFAPGAVWESPLLDLRFESIEQFIDLLQQGNNRPSALIQTANDPVVDLVDDRRARATTTIHELIVRPASSADGGTPVHIDQYGLYHDELERAAGVWRFTHRVFVPVLVRRDGIAGDVVSERPLVRPA